jgi:hypothetical protein
VAVAEPAAVAVAEPAAAVVAVDTYHSLLVTTALQHLPYNGTKTYLEYAEVGSPENDLHDVVAR